MHAYRSEAGKCSRGIRNAQGKIESLKLLGLGGLNGPGYGNNKSRKVKAKHGNGGERPTQRIGRYTEGPTGTCFACFRKQACSHRAFLFYFACLQQDCHWPRCVSVTTLRYGTLEEAEQIGKERAIIVVDGKRAKGGCGRIIIAVVEERTTHYTSSRGKNK